MSLVHSREYHVAEGISLAANPARVSLDTLAARLGIEPLLLAQMENGEEPITRAAESAVETLEREREGTQHSNEPR